MHHQEVSAPFPHPEHKCSTGTQSPSSGSRQWSTSEPSAFLFHSQGKPPSPSYLIHVEFSLFPDTSCILTFYSCKSNLHGEGEQCLSQVCSHWTALCCFHPSTELCVLLTGFPNIPPLQESLFPAIPALLALYHNPGKLPQPFPYSTKARKNISLNCMTFRSFLAHSSHEKLSLAHTKISNAVKVFLAGKQ